MNARLAANTGSFSFYNHEDKPDELPQKENDPVLAAKRAFIQEHHLVIWRFHDHWHSMKRDGIEAGRSHALGWEKFQDGANRYVFAVPESDLAHLACDLNQPLRINVHSVIDDRKL